LDSVPPLSRGHRFLPDRSLTLRTLSIARANCGCLAGNSRDPGRGIPCCRYLEKLRALLLGCRVPRQRLALLGMPPILSCFFHGVPGSPIRYRTPRQPMSTSTRDRSPEIRRPPWKQAHSLPQLFANNSRSDLEACLLVAKASKSSPHYSGIEPRAERRLNFAKTRIASARLVLTAVKEDERRLCHGLCDLWRAL
jgi:hypothetical protein